MNEIKNNYVNWKVFTLMITVIGVLLGIIWNNTSDTRERVIRLEANVDNLIRQIDRGEITFEYNNK